MTIPQELLEMQSWFGEVIQIPLTSGSLNKTLPLNLREKCNDYILPSKTLSSRNRIEIYHQQYWYRLLGVMSEIFSLTADLIGEEAFNQCLAIPYLSQYPPSSFDLEVLGDNILEFIEQVKFLEKFPLLSESLTLDLIYAKLFLCPLEKVSQPVNEDSMISIQPHVELRHTFPSLLKCKENSQHIRNSITFDSHKKFSFIIYRAGQRVTHARITGSESSFLSLLTKPISINTAISVFAKKSAKHNKLCETNILDWFKKWVAHSWIQVDAKN